MFQRSRPSMEVCVARPEDAAEIRRLLTSTSRRLAYSEPWETYLGRETALLTRLRERLVGVLVAHVDAGPVAWVRVAALADGLEIGAWLDRVLPVLAAGLWRARARTLAWADVGGWAGPALRRRGFRCSTRLITFVKEDRSLPPLPSTSVVLRPAREEEVDRLARLDHAAFTPPWWLSPQTLLRMVRRSACFLVAEREGECVGYVEGHWIRRGAHIGRLAVAPLFEGQGIGGRLLAEALRRLWQQGVQRVTLNTQEDNLRSRRLYARFGFHPIGRPINVWERLL
ncbi:MAG TPA: GNAT family N-acetyltransferase [Thermoflexia bacterium]|nr:GNAT family N-acetyltransferase [Thermoflexia bacterium]